jgi:hypothetical protein
MSSATYDAIRQAILDRMQVVATYQGHVREMCPHAIGMKNGRQHVLFFQFGGSSSRGLPPGGEWRCMDVSTLFDVEIVTGDWHTSFNHSRPQTCIDFIDVEVDY